MVRPPPGVRPPFTPTGASWLNQVERFFAPLTGRRIRRGSFRGVADLERAIADYLDTHNQKPRPFAWAKSADLILDQINRTCERLVPTKNSKRTSDSGR